MGRNRRFNPEKSGPSSETYFCDRTLAWLAPNTCLMCSLWRGPDKDYNATSWLGMYGTNGTLWKIIENWTQ